MLIKISSSTEKIGKTFKIYPKSHNLKTTALLSVTISTPGEVAQGNSAVSFTWRRIPEI